MRAAILPLMIVLVAAAALTLIPPLSAYVTHTYLSNTWYAPEGPLLMPLSQGLNSSVSSNVSSKVVLLADFMLTYFNGTSVLHPNNGLAVRALSVCRLNNGYVIKIRAELGHWAAKLYAITHREISVSVYAVDVNKSEVAGPVALSPNYSKAMLTLNNVSFGDEVRVYAVKSERNMLISSNFVYQGSAYSVSSSVSTISLGNQSLLEIRVNVYPVLIAPKWISGEVVKAFHANLALLCAAIILSLIAYWRLMSWGGSRATT